MTCKTCFFYKPSSLQGRGNCRVNPPVVQFMPAMIPTAAEKSGLALPAKASQSRLGSGAGDVQMGIAPMSALPMVLDTDFCQHFREQAATNK